MKSVYKTHIDVIHYRKTDSKRLHGLDEEAEQKLFSEKRVELLKELSRKPDIYERLASALAPSIYEHEDIKKVRRAGVLGPLGKQPQGTKSQAQGHAWRDGSAGVTAAEHLPPAPGPPALW